jgi:hypothetical protein
MTENSDTRFMSKGFLTDFIEMYKQHPALWNTKSKDYYNKTLKNKGYNDLVTFCKTVYPFASREFVTKKIQNMRGCFRKELRKVEESLRSGVGADDIYEPRLWYFELLLFTKDQEVPVARTESRKSLSNEEEEGEEEEEEEDDPDAESMENQQTQPQVRICY